MFVAVAASLYEEWCLVEKEYDQARKKVRHHLNKIHSDSRYDEFSADQPIHGPVEAEWPAGVREAPLG